MLLVGAGLCIKSAHRAYRVYPGFDPGHILLAGLRIGMNGYDEATGKIFYRRLQERIAAMPGVESAALSSWFPLGFEGGPSVVVDAPGYDRKPSEDTSVPYAIVSPGYFSTLRIPLVAGRDFTDHDDENAPAVAVINQTMAERFWPGQNPLGRKFHAGWRDLTVVGVAQNGKYRSLNEPPRPFLYSPYRQGGIRDLDLGLCVRTAGDPAAFGNSLQREIHRLDPRVQVWATLPMTGYIKAAYVAPALASRLLVALGIVALALAAMGVYGVVAYAVSQRTQEFGVRIALGAQPRDVLGLVFRYGLAVCAAGLALGLAGSFAITRLLTGFLFGVSPLDPETFIAVPLLLLLTALLACYLPARRATRVNPIDALRAE
jgi:predicted permease